MITIKVISNGTANGTMVVDSATGERIKNVVSVHWSVKVNDVSDCSIVFRNVPAEITAEIFE